MLSLLEMHLQLDIIAFAVPVYFPIECRFPWLFMYERWWVSVKHKFEGLKQKGSKCYCIKKQIESFYRHPSIYSIGIGIYLHGSHLCECINLGERETLPFCICKKTPVEFGNNWKMPCQVKLIVIGRWFK